MKKTRQNVAFYMGKKTVHLNFKEKPPSSEGGLLLIHPLEKSGDPFNQSVK